jgi:hypothetical protein
MRQYVQTDLEADREVANTLAELIIGGSLASFEITADVADKTADEGNRGAGKRLDSDPVHKSVHKWHAKGPFHDRKGPLTW